MIERTDIAWLSGVFDGEGCVYVLRGRRKRGNVVYSINLTIANTSVPLIERVRSILDGIGVKSNLVVEPKYGTRTIFFVRVCRKRDALILAHALLIHATAKRDELQMAIWYLQRANASAHHKASSQDVEVLEAIKAVKHGRAIPAEMKKLVGIN